MKRILIPISVIILLILITGCQKSLGEATTAILVPCGDSDNGLDYYHFGQVIFRDTVYEDKCLDLKTLAETYCINDRHLEAKTYTCEYNCVEGRCATE